MEKAYLKIAEHYESKLEEHGPGYRGMDWPNERDLFTRFEVMLEIAHYHERTRKNSGVNTAKPNNSISDNSRKYNKNSQKINLLDLGCGSGLLADYLSSTNQIDKFDYTGIDVSREMINIAQERLPSYKFKVQDILQQPLKPQEYDFVIMNGVMTEKVSLQYEEMVKFVTSLISAAFSACRFGIAYNVMSAHVDWKRDDLFHWPHDEAATFLINNCSRHFIFRNDYGLYEYTTYIFRELIR